jgi:hypothetical protein
MMGSDEIIEMLSSLTRTEKASPKVQQKNVHVIDKEITSNYRFDLSFLKYYALQMTFQYTRKRMTGEKGKISCSFYGFILYQFHPSLFSSFSTFNTLARCVAMNENGKKYRNQW